MSGADIVAVRVTIRGHVQSVWYRGWTVENAIALGLDGWVRNCRDGSVEALFSGNGHDVETMIARCQEGPAHAHVEAVDRADAEPPTASGFRTLPTQ